MFNPKPKLQIFYDHNQKKIKAVKFNVTVFKVIKYFKDSIILNILNKLFQNY